MLAEHKKILVIRFSSAGDIILTSPFLRALRRKFPDASVHFMVREDYAQLVAHSPHVDRIVRLPRGTRFRDLLKWKSAIIAEEKEYDVVFDLHDSLRSRHVRVGLGRSLYRLRKPTFAKWLLVHRKIDRLQPIVPIPLRYLDVGCELGLEDDGDGLELFLGNTPSPIVAIEERRTIGIAPGARHYTKRWPAAYFTELTGNLLADGARVVLFGSQEERVLCSEVAAGRDGVMNLAGRIDLLQTAAAVDVCDLVITNDSAMSHIAAARRRPVVAIFGSTVQQFGFAPFRTVSEVVENVGLYCRPCTTIGRESCPEGHFRCMREITVETLIAATHL